LGAPLGVLAFDTLKKRPRFRFHVDDLDLRILGLLAWKPGDPVHMARGILRPWDIARELGVHGNTVKTRLAELRASGVLQGLTLLPVAFVMRRARIGSYWLRFEDLAAKSRGLALLERNPQALEIIDYVGPELRVGVLAADGREPDAAAAALAGQASASHWSRFYERTFPGPLPKLGSLDLRILTELLPDALRPFSEVAEAVGVAQRTVRVRFRALADARAFVIVPQLDLGRVQGLLAFELDVEFEPPPDPLRHAAFLNAFPEAFYRSRPTLEAGYVYLAVPTAAEVEDALRRAEAVSGVRRAQVRLVRSYRTPDAVFERLRSELRSELQHLSSTAHGT